MKKKIVSHLRSRSPLVKKVNYLREKVQSDGLLTQVGKLYWHIEQKDRELEALRLKMIRGQEYHKWVAMHYPDSKVVASQRDTSETFDYRPKISIILPVYNTNPNYLRACISSVIDQSYPNWELCIVDDASGNKDTLDLLRHYKISGDPRIRISHSKVNGHISAASNIAVDMAGGEFIALLDHDDVLWPNALYEVVKLLQIHPDADLVYSDEDKVEADGFVHYDPYFKPDWSPHLLECINYITHLSVIRTDLFSKIGGFGTKMVGAQDWDLLLRLTEQTDRVYHVPTVLYSWRAHEGSTASAMSAKGYATTNQKIALESHFKRVKQGYNVHVSQEDYGFWYPKYERIGKPLISIVIPTKDKVAYLERCVRSILDLTTYSHYEIILVDTGSKEPETKEYYSRLKDSLSRKKLTIKKMSKQPFNYSDACNFGAKNARGEYLVMLNNDTEVKIDTWLEDMLGYAQQPNIAAVGAKLLYPTGHIQHAGVTIGIGSYEPVAGHPGIHQEDGPHDMMKSLYINTVRDVSAVTAACLMVSADKFWRVKGFDPKYRVTFNDVDLCLKFRKAGYLNVYLPFVRLVHDESISVGRVLQDRDMSELNRSAKLMRRQWKDIIDSDPYYNQNFHLLSSNFGLDIYPSDGEQ